MKKIAPLSCPKCGEAKRWFCIDQPETPEFIAADAVDDLPVRRANHPGSLLAAGGLFVLGVFHNIRRAIVHAKPVHYHCGVCGFTGKYKQD